VFKTKTTDDPVAQLAEATHRRQAAQDSLRDLEEQVQSATAKRHEAKDDLDRAEGDYLIGAIDEAARKAKLAALEQALIAERTAQAHIRKCEVDIERLHDAIERIAPAAYKSRIDVYVNREAELLREMLALLEPVERVNNLLYENFVAAEAEFPVHWDRRKGPRLFPPAAGLVNRSWHELRHDPTAMNGGKLGTWRRAVDERLDPKPPAPPVTRAKPAAAPQQPASDSNWHKLPQEVTR
jgi:hypothetical protein